MFNVLKKYIFILKSYCHIRKAFLNDCVEYWRWNYNNPSVKTKNALEAKILRQTHVIEKGMSLSHPREKFGVKKANELLGFIDEFVAYGYKIEESQSVKNSLGVLNAYINYHAARGFYPQDVISHFAKYKQFIAESDQPFGIESISRQKLQEKIEGNFYEFFNSRHSVRQFSDRKILSNDIKKAVKLAMRAPSACNRQSCKVYFFDEKKINDELGQLIAGNTGFESEVANYLVITSDISAFYDAFERNQVYVDGGIFAMALVEALHYYGIASCILQNGEFKERNKIFKEICSIPTNEKIILFIAIGYYKEDVVTYATSHRKKLEEVLCINE